MIDSHWLVTGTGVLHSNQGPGELQSYFKFQWSVIVISVEVECHRSHKGLKQWVLQILDLSERMIYYIMISADEFSHTWPGWWVQFHDNCLPIWQKVSKCQKWQLSTYHMPHKNNLVYKTGASSLQHTNDHAAQKTFHFQCMPTHSRNSKPLATMMQTLHHHHTTLELVQPKRPIF
jgi:hypothetical protein